MALKLICKNDPIKLGIKEKNGTWNMLKFYEHVKQCTECQGLTDMLTKRFIDAVKK